MYVLDDDVEVVFDSRFNSCISRSCVGRDLKGHTTSRSCCQFPCFRCKDFPVNWNLQFENIARLPPGKVRLSLLNIFISRLFCTWSFSHFQCFSCRLPLMKCYCCYIWLFVEDFLLFLWKSLTPDCEGKLIAHGKANTLISRKKDTVVDASSSFKANWKTEDSPEKWLSDCTDWLIASPYSLEISFTGAVIETLDNDESFVNAIHRISHWRNLCKNAITIICFSTWPCSPVSCLSLELKSVSLKWKETLDFWENDSCV